MVKPAFDFSHLSPAGRIQLAEDLWDSLAPDALPLSPAQADELRRRRQALGSTADPGQDWHEALPEIERDG